MPSAGDRLVLVLTQKDPQAENPQPEELYQTGCVALIMRMLKLPDGTIRILIQGLSRARVDYFTRTEPSFEARLTPLEEPDPGESELEAKAFVRSIKQGLERVSTLGKQISPEVILITSGLEDPLSDSPISRPQTSGSTRPTPKTSSKPSTRCRD